MMQNQINEKAGDYILTGGGIVHQKGVKHMFVFEDENYNDEFLNLMMLVVDFYVN
jgi:hypothetical protein